MTGIHKAQPRDRLLYVLLVAVIAVFNVVAFLVLRWLWPDFVSSNQLATHIAMLGLNVGVVKSGCDRISNRLMDEVGLPPLHSVEPLDILAPAAGGLSVAAWLAAAGIS